MFMRQILLSFSLVTILLSGGPGFTQVPRPELRIGSTGTVVGELQTTLRLLGYYSGEATGTYDEATVIAVYQFQRAAQIPETGVMDSVTWNALLPTAGTNVANNAGPTTPTISATAPTIQSTPDQAAPRASEPSPTPAAQATTPSQTSSQTASNTATTTANNPAPNTLPLLKEGMDGDAVKLLQTRLQALGHYQGAIDGIFGPNTRLAVIAAQTAFNIDGDGIVGIQTWTKLLN
jgi:N-acetylmuramoyl-L-alanine amidase